MNFATVKPYMKFSGTMKPNTFEIREVRHRSRCLWSIPGNDFVKIQLSICRNEKNISHRVLGFIY